MKLGLDSRAVHAGRAVDPGTGAVTPPIHPSTTFERDRDGGYRRGYAYATFGNPNREALEAGFAALEGGAEAVAFASGMAAIAGVLSWLGPGDHLVAPAEVFQGTARLIREELEPRGLDVSFVDATRPEAVAAALKPTTRMVWIDTPSSALLRITDVAALSRRLRGRRACLVVDNTYATPALQRPLDLGADASVSSTTKFASGHADAVGGIAVFREAGPLAARARAHQVNAGAVPSPFDCWLVHRGLRTLPLRMGRHSASALAVARFLADDPRVEAVHYPGLPEHPGHGLAARQMAAFGGIISMVVRGGRPAAMAVAGRVELFTRATSLGGTESLIEHRASSPVQTTGAGTGHAVPEDLLRLSIGLEGPDDLIADLDRALAGAGPG